jgi:hypothetical protein
MLQQVVKKYIVIFGLRCSSFIQVKIPETTGEVGEGREERGAAPLTACEADGHLDF